MTKRLRRQIAAATVKIGGGKEVRGAPYGKWKSIGWIEGEGNLFNFKLELQ
jgi:hypothetical protein